MNMMKKNGGFTLVELIVVIAILAILAGVAVPAYSGYIAKANEAADVTQLDAVKTAAVFCVNELSPGATVTEIKVATSGAVTADYTPATGDAVNDAALSAISTYWTAPSPVFSSAKYSAKGATWTSAGWDATP